MTLCPNTFGVSLQFQRVTENTTAVSKTCHNSFDDDDDNDDDDDDVCVYVCVCVCVCMYVCVCVCVCVYADKVRDITM